jgi:phage-related protein
MKRFEVIFLQNAKDFLDDLDDKSREKILFNIRKSRETNDPRLFKKLNDEIWEFRTLFNKIQYRLFAFWLKNNDEMRLVIASHGIVKKTRKTSKNEIAKAEKIRNEYLNNK